jgi:hypothetical protein
MTATRALRVQQEAIPVIGYLAGASRDHEHARRRDR